MIDDDVITDRPKRCPTHPGVILRDSVLPSLRMSVTDAARELGVTRQTLHRVMSGDISVSPAMAVRLGKWCGNGPALWLRMQQAHDLWRAEQALGDALKEIPSHGVAAE
ncbi:HigA family addiction module antitoxin [Pararhodospirillum oryzae]|uniref:Transcriptional regulator n=1 Tax=Pararhodospirillum oryzae TaxID=478448 RepID=A0A512H8D9_9PROT|nr:HigA family addiction module antitoxin [Pararhodospirillum oryzae]GEO81716.1 transcriptional regulator [Pararhodospirillum oryzae]